MTFPDLPQNSWRAERPYIITLTHGDRLPAYPIHAKKVDDRLMFGVDCEDPLWLISDSLIEHPAIEVNGSARIIDPLHVTEWVAL